MNYAIKHQPAAIFSISQKTGPQNLLVLYALVELECTFSPRHSVSKEEIRQLADIAAAFNPFLLVNTLCLIN